MKRIVLAIVVNDLAMAGVQRLAVDQVQLLPSEIYELHLIVLRKQRSPKDFFDLVPAHVRVHRFEFSSLRDISSWIKLFKLLRSIKPDIVKSSLFFSNTVMRLCCLWYRYVLITAEHNTDLVKKRSQSAFNQLLYHLDFAMVVDSQMVATFLSQTENIPKNHFRVIYNGTDIEEIKRSEKVLLPQRSKIRSELGVQEDDFLFITVARLVKQKDHSLMIRAFTSVHQSCQNARLVIVGEGQLRPELEHLIAQSGLEGKVQLVGEYSDTHPFYIASDCFLMTSRHEGFCIAAMDGLAFGKPLISTKVAGIEEYLRHGINGFFVERSVDSIAETMKAVVKMSSEQKERLREAARETASHYSKQKFKDAYLTLFREAYVSRCNK